MAESARPQPTRADVRAAHTQPVADVDQAVLHPQPSAEPAHQAPDAHAPSHDPAAPEPSQDLEETTAPERNTTPTPTAEKPLRSDFMEGAAREAVTVNPEIARQAAERILNRVDVATRMESAQRPLTPLEKIVIAQGKEAAARIQAGTATSEDFAIAWFEIHDELIQKQGSAGEMVEHGVLPAERFPLWTLRFGNRTDARTDTTLANGQVHLSSEYTRFIQFDKETGDRIEGDLKNLNNLRLGLEQALTGRSPATPEFDHLSSSINPTDIAKTAGVTFRNAISRELDARAENSLIAKRFPGKSFQEVYRENPVEATKILHEANQIALAEHAGEAALQALKSEAPSVSTAEIENQAKKLETKPDQKDIDELHAKATKAKTELTHAQQAYKEANKPFEDADKAVAEARGAYERAQRFYTEQSGRFDRRKDEIYHEINQQLAMRENTAGIKDEAAQARVIEANEEIRKRVDALQAEIAAGTRRLDDLYERQENALAAREQREEERNELNADLEKTTRRHDAMEELNEKHHEYSEAEHKYKEKKDAAAGDLPEENKVQAKGLRMWAKTINSFEDAMDVRFSQRRNDEFAIAQLTNTATTAGGEIYGAERIREHIFALTGKADYDADLARKLVSDEEIAWAIAHVYNLELPRDLPETPAPTPDPDDPFGLGTPLPTPPADAGKYLVTQMLSKVNNSEFMAGELIRFITEQGLLSAQRGRPFLTIENRFGATTPTLTTEAGSYHQETSGTMNIDIENRRLTWEGDVAGVINFARTPSAPPLHMRVTQQFVNNMDEYLAEVRVDQNLLQTLPPYFDANTVPSPLRQLYDPEGRIFDLRSWVGQRVRFGETNPQRMNAPEGEQETWITLVGG